jgi:hypothetical protein
MKKKKQNINKDISIEDLLEQIPESVVYLREKGIRCFVCGEPTWGTLESAAKEKGFKDKDIDLFVKEINELGLQSSEKGKGKKKFEIKVKEIKSIK